MDMARRRLDLRLPEELIARVDAAADRLGQTRTKFVERALESALDNVKGSATSGGTDQAVRARVDPATESSVSSRAPDEPVANVLGAPVRKSPKTPSLKDTWGR